jgi:hypothetical protein
MLYQQHNSALSTVEQGTIPAQNNYHWSAENPVALQHEYTIPLNSPSTLMGSYPGSLNNQQLTTMQQYSNQIYSTSYNQQELLLQQTPQSQRPVSSSASHFPHLVSALRAEPLIVNGVYRNEENVTVEHRVSETSSSTYSRNDHACSWLEETRCERPSSSEFEARACYEAPPDVCCNAQELPSCALQTQAEQQMSALAPCHAGPETKEGNSQFAEMPSLEPSWQESSAGGFNQLYVSTEEPNSYSEITTRLCLLDLNTSLGELYQTDTQNDTSTRQFTNMLWNTNISRANQVQVENTSTVSPQMFYQL